MHHVLSPHERTSMPHELNLLDAALAAYPRVALLEGPTPIQKLVRLSQLPELNGCSLYVKRDDLTGLGGGGNKLRKLEFLLGEALAENADTLVTWGGFQSNHARLTAAVAARHGLACELILTPSAVRSDNDFCHNGNVLLDDLFGAKVHRLSRGVTPDSYAAELVAKLRNQGKKPFVMPLGGSSPRGSLGYAACAAEILQQADALGLRFDQIIVPNGSAGTYSGLLAGVTLGPFGNKDCRLLGIGKRRTGAGHDPGKNPADIAPARSRRSAGRKRDQRRRQPTR
jgi:L-cysteate sulfo-lyase